MGLSAVPWPFRTATKSDHISAKDPPVTTITGATPEA
jgi:hypothetical protein